MPQSEFLTDKWVYKYICETVVYIKMNLNR